MIPIEENLTCRVGNKDICSPRIMYPDYFGDPLPLAPPWGSRQCVMPWNLVLIENNLIGFIFGFGNCFVKIFISPIGCIMKSYWESLAKIAIVPNDFSTIKLILHTLILHTLVTLTYINVSFLHLEAAEVSLVIISWSNRYLQSHFNMYLSKGHVIAWTLSLYCQMFALCITSPESLHLNWNVLQFVFTVFRRVNECRYTIALSCSPVVLGDEAHALTSPASLCSCPFEAGSLCKYVLRQDGLLH